MSPAGNARSAGRDKLLRRSESVPRLSAGQAEQAKIDKDVRTALSLQQGATRARLGNCPQSGFRASMESCVTGLYGNVGRATDLEHLHQGSGQRVHGRYSGPCYVRGPASFRS